MTRSRNTEIASSTALENLSSEDLGFESAPDNVVSSKIANAAAATLAALSLSLCLVVALAALSIKVMAATALAG